MNWTKWGLVVGILCLFNVTACAGCEDRLNGKWNIKLVLQNGQAVTAQSLGEAAFAAVFDMENKTVTMTGGRVKDETWTFTLKECAKEKIVIVTNKNKRPGSASEEEVMTILFLGPDEIRLTQAGEEGEVTFVRDLGSVAAAK